MTRLLLSIYSCGRGSGKTPPYAMDVWLVALLEMESLLQLCGPGQQIHILPSILDRMRMMAVIIRPMIAMQDDRIVGQ